MLVVSRKGFYLFWLMEVRMKNKFEKMQSLRAKVEQLKIEHDKIEQEIIHQLVQVLKINDAFQIDFNSLVGGLLEIIKAIRIDPDKKEAWRVAGQKFCKSSIRTKLAKIKTNLPVEEQYD